MPLHLDSEAQSIVHDGAVLDEDPPAAQDQDVLAALSRLAALDVTPKSSYSLSMNGDAGLPRDASAVGIKHCDVKPWNVLYNLDTSKIKHVDLSRANEHECPGNECDELVQARSLLAVSNVVAVYTIATPAASPIAIPVAERRHANASPRSRLRWTCGV
ncbi:hypothetical protein Rt10032_c22g6626 [Rhodotorula toruloides]|uniref:Protein kinase domain-containing protein n=1 Tax=Rhodotorula toruloides TaxID=5286 RepID=A0A511KQF3_RHOTO|nr:hypothetical protein Rt10032_c22g6626 [Rhodotorula toruloides]